MTAPDQKTILIIEDDRKTAALVSLYLEREGFRAVAASNGREGLALAARYRPALVILDLMLPKLDGWEVCRQMRQASQVPIIMLTARSEEIDRVAGLTLGADDYVVKPFSPRELVARVRAVLRRSGQEGSFSRVLAHGEIRLDLDKRQLLVGGRPVDLTPHEYVLLEVLMKTPGKTFTRDELVGRLYPRGEVVVDKVVDVHIGKLRKKIAPDTASPRHIETIRGIGYRFSESPEAAARK